ncbi:proto-oncogene DBL-like isoform X2 [Phyllopteryx taeniolatus]|uniref:proto-oncogene DBL-like isoform X2 n=1 Tax=Phyllopteryx taeniolatus TaxID=161469 RepID=UPI002AD206C1|nr:proto-oncogene DBL-like isoform X2 [Phyllopteryx taeniolatus]
MAESKPQRGFPRLRRATTSFPGNLHLVLVLRPSGLLSSAPSPSSSTDLDFRFSHDDFLFRMPVVMLRSVGDLLRYIDDNRLTSDLRGDAERCRGDWIVLRSAIETFAVTVKEAAHLLQGFGSELSDGELPDDADAVDFLLRSHTQRYRHMKEDITGLLKEGRLLLDNLETHLASTKDTAEDEEDVQSDLHTVQRLLAQLRDMEEAFDGFFEKHHLKMQQCHQLLLYERSFQLMEEELEKTSGEEKAIPAVGNTLLRTEQLLKDLHALEQRAEEVMSRAGVLTLQGHQLAARHHYALALIMQRCNELRHHCDVISGGLRSKRATLVRAKDLFTRLDQALRWCDEGAYLLASQMVDRFQSREGAQEALQYLSRHRQRAPDVLDGKQDVLSLEFEAILTPQLQSQISMVTDKLASMRAMIHNREQCLRKMADVRVRPVQPVAPRPEAEPAEPTALHGVKAPLFSPKHGVDFNLLNSRFPFDLLPGKRTSRRTSGQRKIEVMHDYQGNRSSLYGSAPDSDSEAEEGAEQVMIRIMKELISTEKIYVEELLAVLLGYRAEMEDPSMCDLLPSLLRSHKDVLFGNMPQIYRFHSGTFLQDLQRCLDTPERVGQCFLQRVRKTRVTLTSVAKQTKSSVRVRVEGELPDVRELLPEQASLGVAMETVLGLRLFPGVPEEAGPQAVFGLVPAETHPAPHQVPADPQGSARTHTLTGSAPAPHTHTHLSHLCAQELLKHCTEPQYRTQLQEALDCMLDLVKSVNDSMHQTAIVGYQGELGPLGRVLLQGGFGVWISRKRGGARMRELARFKAARRHVFLYERALVCCKRRDDRRSSPVYSFKSCLGVRRESGKEKRAILMHAYVNGRLVYTQMNSVSVTENVKGDAKKFELCHRGTQEVYILQAPSTEVKVAWLTEIQKIISQLHKDTLISDSSFSHARSARWEESVNTSPAHSDPTPHSPPRAWPAAAHSVAICDGLEDWGATDGSNVSDTDDDDDDDDDDERPAPLAAGRYRVLVASSTASSDDIIFMCGDVIQLLHCDADGMWLVRNVSRDEEGRVLAEDLHRILGETC